MTLEKRDGLAILTMNRPDRRNAITVGMVAECYRLLTDLSHDLTTRVVVLTGAGSWFSPGGDIDAVVNDNWSDMDQDPYPMRVPVLLHEMPQVTIAAINGSCGSAALGWALACDLRISVPMAKFSTAFIERGFSGDMSIPWTLPRIVGAGRARMLSLLPSKMDGEQALSIGLVDHVFPEAEFDSGVNAIVERLLSFDGQALRTIKEHYVVAERMQFRDFADFESRVVSRNIDPAQFAVFLADRESNREANRGD